MSAQATHDQPPPNGQYCYLIADDEGAGSDADVLIRIDTGFSDESFIGYTGTTGIEALAMRQGDLELFAADRDIFGGVNKHSAAFTPTSGAPWGSGDGSLGSQSLSDADGLSFHPDGRLYASIRRESPTPPEGDGLKDLLIEVDPNTGALVQDAFGPGVDYVVVSDEKDDVDDITFDSSGVLWGVTNNGGVDSHLVKIDTSSGATFDRKPIDSDPGNPAINQADDIEGLAWGNENGQPTWFGVNNKTVPGTGDTISRLWAIDPATGSASFRFLVGETSGAAAAGDFEGMACEQHHVDIFPISDVLPPRALNSTENLHVFTVRTCQDPNGNDACDPAEPRLAGQHPEITVTPPEDEVSNTCETGPGTDSNGECTVTVARSTAGTTTVTASLTVTIDGGTFSDTDTGIKVFLLMCKCIDFFDVGEDMPLRIKFVIPDTDPNTPGDQGLTNITVTDNLPPEYIFEGATAINGVNPNAPPPHSLNGQVVWELASLAPGTYEGDIFVSLVPGLADGTKVVNRLRVEAEGFEGAATTTHAAVFYNDARTRAYGLQADLLGGGTQPATPDFGPTPDSDVQNPDELIAVPNPLPGATGPLVRALTVQEADGSTINESSAWAESKAVEPDINIPGVVRVQADAVVARAESSARAMTATSTAGGSAIANLRINGTHYGDISEPTTVVIPDPLNPVTPFVEVHLLESQLSGGAAGVQQPELFDPADPNSGWVTRSGIIVNGIHVVVHNLPSTPIDEASDVQVAHAEAFGGFGPGVDCMPG